VKQGQVAPLSPDDQVPPLPKPPNSVLIEQAFAADRYQALQLGLGDQQAVEWVTLLAR
jgi:hypothetical protein